MIWINRAKKMRILFLLLLLLLAGRLYYVQIVCADELTEAAKGQQLIPVLWESGGMAVYDRNMVPLTETKNAYYYLLHKDNMTAGSVRLLQQMGAQLAGKKGEDYLLYQTSRYFPNASLVLQKRWNAYGFSAGFPTEEEPMTKTLAAALEVLHGKSFHKQQPNIYFLGNGAGSVITGTGILEEKTGNAGLVTTLDMTLQQQLESIFEEANISGCAVVTDTRNGQVLAIVANDEK